MKKFAIIVGSIVVGGLILFGGCAVLIGGAADEVEKEFEAGSSSDRVKAGEDSSGGGERYSWENLMVEHDKSLDTFAGSLRLTNETDEPAEVYVEVTAYDGEQTLGTLNGNARVKPGATTKIKLTSLDDYAKPTDYEVTVDGF